MGNLRKTSLLELVNQILMAIYLHQEASLQKMRKCRRAGKYQIKYDPYKF